MANWKWKRIVSWILLITGLAIVGGTHSFLGFGIFMGNLELSGTVFSQHIIVNLLAFFMLLIGLLLRIDSEK